MESIILSLLIKNCAVDGVAPERLARVIVETAESEGQDPVLVAKIIVVESSCRAGAMNAKTHDVGIMQINETTARNMGVDRTCLLNWKCNIKTGVEVLSGFRRPCSYNVGNKVSKRMKSCLRYERRLDMVSNN